jgi:hypothetical protein
VAFGDADTIEAVVGADVIVAELATGVNCSQMFTLLGMRQSLFSSPRLASDSTVLFMDEQNPHVHNDQTNWKSHIIRGEINRDMGSDFNCGIRAHLVSIFFVDLLCRNRLLKTAIFAKSSLSAS